MSRKVLVQEKQRTGGFTLVELLVSVVLGLFIITAVISSFITNKEVYRINESLARMQESGRILNELMSREIREAGGNLCGTPLVANVLNNKATSWWANWDAGIVVGFDQSQDTAPKTFGTGAQDRLAGTDAIIVRSSGLYGATSIVSNDENNATITLNSTAHGLSTGDIFVACDYLSAAIAQASNAGSGSAVITHAAGGSNPGNCSKGLGYPTPSPCNTTVAGTSLKTFSSNGFVSRLTASFWYVGNNSRGGHSLFRMAMDGDPDNVTPVEVIEGVEDLQIQYLTRNGGTLANAYVDASSISDWTRSAANQVVAVRLTVTLRSEEDHVGTDGNALNRVLVYAISLRNREIVE